MVANPDGGHEARRGLAVEHDAVEAARGWSERQQRPERRGAFAPEREEVRANQIRDGRLLHLAPPPVARVRAVGPQPRAARPAGGRDFRNNPREKHCSKRAATQRARVSSLNHAAASSAGASSTQDAPVTMRTTRRQGKSVSPTKRATALVAAVSGGVWLSYGLGGSGHSASGSHSCGAITNSDQSWHACTRHVTSAALRKLHEHPTA